MGKQNNQFDRVASDLVGPSHALSLLVTITQPSEKYLSSIYLSAIQPIGPATVETVVCRVAVFSQQGKFPDLSTILDFNPLTSLNQDVTGDIGTIYFDQVLTLPNNQQIFFDDPIYFSAGQSIYVAASVTYANADSLLNPPSRNMRLSVRGHFVNSNTKQYLSR